ncbi:MAG: class A beta-lactamase, subclass A2 [Sphingobacteriaceae bacterium]|nr:MAG: class A beta-lactamase, subclass A2 [Sphingobacteriaceae bacterium]
MLKTFSLLVFLTLVLWNFKAFAQSNSLKNQVIEIAKEAKATIGISIFNIETRKRVSYNENLHLPMQSVMKFPIAITVLHKIDEGKLKQDQLIHIDKEDLPETYSPLRDKFPEGNIDVSIKDLLSYMVSLSDNDACDILLKTIGGPKQVDTYMHQLSVKNISVKASEFQMAQNWNVQFTNWCEPAAMTQLLDLSLRANFLSRNSHAFLWKILQETSTGPKQLKGLLPEGTIVAHKTGRSGTNKQGITAATNDVGVITLPNGKHLAIAIFISNSSVDLATRESVIARIAKAVYKDGLN